MDYENIILDQLETLGFKGGERDRLAKALLRDTSFLAEQPQGLSESFFDLNGKAQTTTKLLEIDLKLILQAALYHPTILTRNPERLAGNALDASVLLGIDFKKYVLAVLPYKADALFTPGETIEENVRTTAEALGLSREDYIELCLHQPTLFVKTKEFVTGIVDKGSKLLGVTIKQFIGMGETHPSLLYEDPKNINAHAEGQAALMGMSKAAYIALILKDKQAQILIHDPEALSTNADESSRLLGITREAFIKMAKKRLTILAYEPQTLKDKVEAYAEVLNIDEKRALKFCMAAPQFFTLDPKETDDKIKDFCKLLGVERSEFIRATLNFPQVLYQKPATVNTRVEKSAELLGMDKADFINMALAKANLFYRDPETLAENKRLMERFNGRGIIVPAVEKFYKKKPDALAVAPDNYHVRYVYARAAGIEDAQNFGVLRTSRYQIEAKLVELYGHDPDRKTITRPAPKGLDLTKDEQRHRALVAMVKSGLIKSYAYEPNI